LPLPVLKDKAPEPTTVFAVPEVTAFKALYPTAVLSTADEVIRLGTVVDIIIVLSADDDVATVEADPA
jgi:hypothetical protein